jgi:hypothetical protein
MVTFHSSILRQMENEMKDQRPPDTPDDFSNALDPFHTPYAHDRDTSTRNLLQAWTPQTAAEARAMLDDAVFRANALANILAECYRGAENPYLMHTLDLLTDLLEVASSTVEWWCVRESCPRI